MSSVTPLYDKYDAISKQLLITVQSMTILWRDSTVVKVC